MRIRNLRSQIRIPRKRRNPLCGSRPRLPRKKSLILTIAVMTASRAVAQEGEAAILGMTKEKPCSWLIDSGATSHCTGDKSIFTSFTPADGGLLEDIGGSPDDCGKAR